VLGLVKRTSITACSEVKRDGGLIGVRNSLTVTSVNYSSKKLKTLYSSSRSLRAKGYVGCAV